MKTCFTMPDRMNYFPLLYSNLKLFELLSEFTQHVYTADEVYSLHCIPIHFSSISNFLHHESITCFIKRCIGTQPCPSFDLLFVAALALHHEMLIELFRKSTSVTQTG